MSQDTNISQLVINKLTKQQYDSIVTPNESELYLITDDVGITDTDIIAALGYTPQEELVSGTNIKTINNTSLLGSGNIEIQGGGSITIDQTYDPTSANAQSGVAIAGANFLTASSLNNYVTTNTDQNITGTKTFVGQKKIGFKQSASNNKLGFTLYDNNNVEKGYLEFNPSNTVDGVPLMTLGNYATASGGLTHVGFRKYSNISGASGAYNLLAPLVSKAKSPFSLTTTYTNFYLPLGFTNGTTTVKTANTGMVDLSPILPTNVLPSQTGQSGKFLTTDGTNPSWATVSVTVDQTYDPTSTNAQSGVALSEVFNEKQDTLIAGDHITINEATPHWSQAEEVSNLHLNSFDWVSIAYGDNKFVILGDEGYTSTSTDGIEWTSAVKNPNLYQPCVGYTVIYGDGKFVALSYEGHLSSSVDGVTWAASETVSVLEYGGWKSIAYGNGKFVALGSMGDISTSTDGATWTQPEQYAPDEYGDSAGYNVIAYGSNKFVVMDARGYVATSTNGTDWTDLGAISNLGNHGWEALTYDGEKFIAIGGDGYFSSSEDGVTWELSVLIPQLEVDTRWVSVACSESKIVTLGNSNYIGVYSDVSGPMISAHFDVDQIFDSTSTNAQSGIAIAGALDKKQTKLIAGNNIEILEPSWSQAKTVSNLDIHDPWGSIAYGANKFVIVGTDGYLSTSEDGLNWTLAEQNENLHYANSIGYDALAYGDGKFVAESNSAISTSTDGVTWSSVTYSSNLSGYDWKDMAYGDGKFVILGADGFISTSTDGTTWTQATQAIENSEIQEYWRSIAYNGIKFVALSGGGYISISTDGVAWSTPVQNSTLGDRAWRSIVYNGTKFVALDSTGRYSTSADGTTWTTVVQDSNLGNRGWTAMASNEEKIVAVNSYTYVSEYYNNPLISASFVPFTGADGTNAGTSGAVPAPLASDNNKFLKGDGTWGAVTTNALVIRDYTVSS